MGIDPLCRACLPWVHARQIAESRSTPEWPIAASAQESDRIPNGCLSRHAPAITETTVGPAPFDIERCYVKTANFGDYFRSLRDIKVNYSTIFLNFYLHRTKFSVHFI